MGKQERGRELRQQISQLVTQLAELSEDDATPFVTGWALAYEYETTELVGQHMYGGALISPMEQSSATTRGLLLYGLESSSPRPAWAREQ